jgi:hypothetical protein
MALARYLMRLSLGIWIGGLVFFPFLAQNAFSTLASRQSAGLIVGKSLINLHWIGLGCGVVFLICSVASRGARKFAVGNLLVLLMMIGTSISQFGVIPRMDAIRASIPGEIDSVPADNPARAKFDTLHKASTDIEGLILLMGLGALYLAG